jgi:hypothetical protein
MPRRQHGGDFRHGGAGFHGLMLRNQNVDAVGFAVDVIIDPFQFFFQRFGAESCSAQHAETACAAHGSHHVTAMTEGEKRKFRAYELRDFEGHF